MNEAPLVRLEYGYYGANTLCQFCKHNHATKDESLECHDKLGKDKDNG